MIPRCCENRKFVSGYHQVTLTFVTVFFFSILKSLRFNADELSSFLKPNCFQIRCCDSFSWWYCIITKLRATLEALKKLRPVTCKISTINSVLFLTSASNFEFLPALV